MYEYTVYGRVAAQDPNHPNPYMFTGRRFDFETGLYYYRARYYNPYIGRFMQTDPVGYSAGINWYRYCRNNPLGMVDPYGLMEVEVDIPIHCIADPSRVGPEGSDECVMVNNLLYYAGFYDDDGDYSEWTLLHAYVEGDNFHCIFFCEEENYHGDPDFTDCTDCTPSTGIEPPTTPDDGLDVPIPGTSPADQIVEGTTNIIDRIGGGLKTMWETFIYTFFLRENTRRSSEFDRKIIKGYTYLHLQPQDVNMTNPVFGEDAVRRIKKELRRKSDLKKK